MNTTEIITKLRAQAAELTAMADALEEATSTAAFATGAGRYLIHGSAKVGDWTTYDGVPIVALAEDTEGDYFVKRGEGRTWVGVDMGRGGEWHPALAGIDGSHEQAMLMSCLDRCRVIALGLTGRETADEIRSLVERFKASQVPA